MVQRRAPAGLGSQEKIGHFYTRDGAVGTLLPHIWPPLIDGLPNGQKRTQDFEKGGGPGISENLRRTEVGMDIVSLKFSPIICPKLGKHLTK